jgi:hypothetical protein
LVARLDSVKQLAFVARVVAVRSMVMLGPRLVALVQRPALPAERLGQVALVELVVSDSEPRYRVPV